MEADDCIVEIGVSMESDRTALFNVCDRSIWITASEKNEEHGDESGGSLHASIAVNQDSFSSIIFGGNTIDALEGPKTCITNFYGLEIVVKWNTV
jgi:hypothetical protein